MDSGYTSHLASFPSLCIFKPEYYILHLILFNAIGLTHYTSHASHIPRHRTLKTGCQTSKAASPGWWRYWVGKLLSLVPPPAPAFLLRQDTHQRANSHTTAQAVPTCKRSGATWWERMREELLRAHGGLGGASPWCECQMVTPRSLPASAAAHQDRLKYLYFPSSHSRISLNSHPPQGIKIYIPPVLTSSDKGSLQHHIKVRQSLYWIQS